MTYKEMHNEILRVRNALECKVKESETLFPGHVPSALTGRRLFLLRAYQHSRDLERYIGRMLWASEHSEKGGDKNEAS